MVKAEWSKGLFMKWWELSLYECDDYYGLEMKNELMYLVYEMDIDSYVDGVYTYSWIL